MVIYSRALETSAIIPVILDSSSIDFVNKIRNLGIILDNTFSWHIQTTSICRAVSCVLCRLWRILYLTPELSRLKLVRYLIVPHFLYCSVIMGSLYFWSLRRLIVALNSYIWYVKGLRRYDYVSPYIHLFGTALSFVSFFVTYSPKKASISLRRAYLCFINNEG